MSIKNKEIKKNKGTKKYKSMTIKMDLYDDIRKLENSKNETMSSILRRLLDDNKIHESAIRNHKKLITNYKKLKNKLANVVIKNTEVTFVKIKSFKASKKKKKKEI